MFVVINLSPSKIISMVTWLLVIDHIYSIEPSTLKKLAISHGIPEVILNEYRIYLSKFGKSDENMYDPSRVRNFANTVQYIHEFNSQDDNNKFTLGLNHMADWHDHEKSSLFTSTPLYTVNNTEIYTVMPDNRIVLKSILSAESADVDPYNQNLVFSGSGNWNGLNANANADSSSGYPNYNPPYDVNWASFSNPRSQPVVPGVRNQGMCGSCWAFVSSAMTEASVKINTGFRVPLSVQELIDCDNDYNRGCLGGNPIFAFEYIVSEGLTGWYDYPYREQAGRCMRYNFLPRASVQGYTIISTMNQMMIKRFVANGPVAVGVCGTDQSFLFYSGGVYNPYGCCTTLNHALLLVGYGHDDSTGLDYWVAQNSWGTMWGEKGYMRILRTNSVGTPGMCGLALSPSTVMGGYTLNMGADNDSTASYLYRLKEWAAENAESLVLSVASLMMVCSLLLFGYGWVEGRRIRSGGASRGYSLLGQRSPASGKTGDTSGRPSSSGSLSFQHHTPYPPPSPGATCGKGGYSGGGSGSSGRSSRSGSCKGGGGPDGWQERGGGGGGDSLPIGIQVLRGSSLPPLPLHSTAASAAINIRQEGPLGEQQQLGAENLLTTALNMTTASSKYGALSQRPS